MNNERHGLMAAALKDYAIIGDCRTAAMISGYGSVDWLCLPDFSSPSLFARLLDENDGGYYLIHMPGAAQVTRRYLPGTAIMETTFTGKNGSMRLTDCMPVTPNGRHESELQPQREIVRKVEILDGTAEIECIMEARPGYAACHGEFKNRGQLGWALNHHRYLLNLLTDFPLEVKKNGLEGRRRAKAGDVFWFSLTFESSGPGILLPLGQQAQSRIDITADWWRNWCSQCKHEGEWHDELVRSAITLRLLTFIQSGAIIAAATTSLPERAGGSMNWDYRFSWPRDAAVALSAFMHIGLYDEAESFFGWLMLAAGTTRPRISNFYDIYGRSEIDEHILDKLTGYGGAKPVRIGNVVSHQIQHDVYGEVMMAVENRVHYRNELPDTERRLIEGFGKVVAEEWRKPDNGIWEIRDQRRHYTHSKVMAWHVFDSLLHLKEKKYVDGPEKLYASERSLLREAIEYKGFNEKRNCYSAVFGGDTVDASLLLLPRCGYIAYDDPKMIGTWQAIKNDLERGGLLLRYPPGFADSEPGEGALIICNFWAVNYLIGLKAFDEARERLERLIGLANDVGLYNEAVDVNTREPLGNMPQAYSHAGLITAIMRFCGRRLDTREAA